MQFCKCNGRSLLMDPTGTVWLNIEYIVLIPTEFPPIHIKHSNEFSPPELQLKAIFLTSIAARNSSMISYIDLDVVVSLHITAWSNLGTAPWMSRWTSWSSTWSPACPPPQAGWSSGDGTPCTTERKKCIKSLVQCCYQMHRFRVTVKQTTWKTKIISAMWQNAVGLPRVDHATQKYSVCLHVCRHYDIMVCSINDVTV